MGVEYVRHGRGQDGAAAAVLLPIAHSRSRRSVLLLGVEWQSTNGIDDELVEQHHGARARHVMRAVGGALSLCSPAPLRVIVVARNQRPEGVNHTDLIRAAHLRGARAAKVSPAEGRGRAGCGRERPHGWF